MERFQHLSDYLMASTSASPEFSAAPAKVQQPQQQMRPTYNNVAPPVPRANGVRPYGPRREHYPPLPESLQTIFTVLMSQGLIQLPPERPWPTGLDHTRFCLFHRYAGHDINSCFTFRDMIYDMNDQNRLNWEEIRAIAVNNPNPNMGIYRDPLPNHGTTAPPAQSSGTTAGVNNVHYQPQGFHPSRLIKRDTMIGNGYTRQWEIPQDVRSPTQQGESQATVAFIDDIFDEDYRQYIPPWDGKTQIVISRRNPGLVNLQPSRSIAFSQFFLSQWEYLLLVPSKLLYISLS